MIVARFPLSVVRSSIIAKVRGFHNPHAICSIRPITNVSCGSDAIIGTVGVNALAFGGYFGVRAYLTDTGFSFPA
jgi:hypothetical protein